MSSFGYKYLLFTTFEPEVAGFYGVPTAWVDAMFALTLAGVIVVSLQILGVTMIAAAIVIPPVSARLLTGDFNRMMLLSTAIGALCGLCGVYASWYLDISSGPSVVLFSAAVFMAALAYSSIRNRLAFARWQTGRTAAQPHPGGDSLRTERLRQDSSGEPLGREDRSSWATLYPQAGGARMVSNCSAALNVRSA